MDVSFVIPVFNNAKRLRVCLAAIFSQKTDLQFEVIVVDNGSTDESLAVAKSFPVLSLQVLDAQSPYACRNRGHHSSIGKWVIFLDSNVVIDGDAWLTCLKESLRDPDVDLFVPKYVFDFAGDFPSVAEFVNSFLFLDSKKDAENGGAAGPCLICRRNVFDRFGEFPLRRSNGDTVWTNGLTKQGGSIRCLERLVCRYPAKSEIALRRTQMRIGYGNRLVWLECGRSKFYVFLSAVWNMRPMRLATVRQLVKDRGISYHPSFGEFSVWLCVWRIRFYRGVGRLGFTKFFNVVAD